LDKRETVVQIVLTQSASVSGYKRLALVDKYGSKTYIDTSDQQKSNSIYVRTDILKERVLEFGKWTGVEVHGVYMLGGLEAIKTSTRVTFTWKKDH